MMKNRHALLIWFVLITVTKSTTQQSVARQWNERLLDAIRIDTPRPTVHARNLCHISACMYDAWAVYDEIAEPFLLGKTVDGFPCPFDGIDAPEDPEELKAARNEAVSFAAYRILSHRFGNSPGMATSQVQFDALMDALGYDIGFTSTDFTTGSPAALGNFIAEQYIEFGFVDRSNEAGNYGSMLYQPFNPPLAPALPGTQGILDLNYWQPLSFQPGISTPFLSPHWGHISKFALTDEDLIVYHRDGVDFPVYHDPGPPPWIDLEDTPGLDDDFKWNFALVAVWSGHLDPEDGVMIDISPGTLGNNTHLPQTPEEIRDFYRLEDGGVNDTGYDTNPYTGEPYAPNIVPRADYARVIAEFWADGPHSETPPGHWYTLLNDVNDHPLMEKRFKGEGPELDELEWDVKAYFALGGALHDVAVAVWGMKSWYDYVRPISAIRGMAELGQSSDPEMMSYHPGGTPLIDGFIEVVLEGDALAGENDEHVGKIKLFAWRGPTVISDPASDIGGVDWILAENWWPWQLPTFVTPPFAGYISGHSTFSRAAAETLTLLTGDPYFPGGLGEYHLPVDTYFSFERGPSIDVTLQWATYRDASDQASLSRLYGGIHPPADDIPGRMKGAVIGQRAFAFAEEYFSGAVSSTRIPAGITEMSLMGFPNPFSDRVNIAFTLEHRTHVSLSIYDNLGQLVKVLLDGELSAGDHVVAWRGDHAHGHHMGSGMYISRLATRNGRLGVGKLMLAGTGR